VLRVAKFDGISVLGVAGACALISAAYRDVTGAVVGLIVAGAGAVELHGANMLRNGEGRGMRWLVSSQVYLMMAILGYVGFKLIDQLNDQLKEQGVTLDQALVGLCNLVYLVLAAATVLYQGGMSIYYLRRRAAVAAALEEEIPS